MKDKEKLKKDSGEVSASRPIRKRIVQKEEERTKRGRWLIIFLFSILFLTSYYFWHLQ